MKKCGEKMRQILSDETLPFLILESGSPYLLRDPVRWMSDISQRAMHLFVRHIDRITPAEALRFFPLLLAFFTLRCVFQTYSG